MSGNYAQLTAKADDVIDKTSDVRAKTVTATLAEKEHVQAVANEARTEAEYLKRKHQSDVTAQDLADVVARIASLESQRTSLQTQWTTLHPLVKLFETNGPTAAPGAAGEFYVDTDTSEAYEWDGAAWGASLGPVNAALAVAGTTGKIQAAAGPPTFADPLADTPVLAAPVGTQDGELYVNFTNGDVYEWVAAETNWHGVIGNVTEKQGVAGNVGKISADKGTPGTDYDGTDVIAVEAKKGRITTKRGDIASAERNAQVHRDKIERLNISLVTLRLEEEQLEKEVASLEEQLADLKAQRDSYPTTSTEYATLNGQVTALETGDLATEKTNLANKRGEIDTAKSDISTQETDLAVDIEAVTTGISDLRTLERELATLQGTLDTNVASFTEVANGLQDIDGSDSARTATAFSALANGEVDSQLYTAKAVETALGTANTDIDTIETAVKAEYDAMKALVPTALAAKNSANTQLSTCQTALDTAKSDLRILVDKQKDIEVRAAAVLLEDFLKNENAVLAAAPTVGLSVQTEVDKTCPSSKVNELVSEFRAAYADEDEYKALLARIIENPFAVFFNQIEDPCFVLLTEAEVAAFRADVEARFRAEAQRLLREYGKVSGGSSISTTTLVIIALVVILLVAAFVYMQ